MRILGISAFHRDSAAALLVDGVPVAAAQEEHFTGKLGEWSFPRRAIRSCLDEAGVQARDLDRIVFYEKPLRKFERILAMQLGAFPRSAKTFSSSMFLWLGDRLWMKNRIIEELEVPDERISFVEHQRAHAAASYFTSPFEEAAILSIDDMGEWATTLLARGAGNEIESLREVHFPHSLGLWYSAFAQYLGFEPGADEGLLEELAKQGTPSSLDKVRQTLSACGEEGGFQVHSEHFRFQHDASRLYSQGLIDLLGPARAPGSPISEGPEDTRCCDLAASVQAVLEERVLALAEELHRHVPSSKLCLSGEVARNRSLVRHLRTDGPFEQIYIPPSPGEPGAALGAALEYSCSIAGEPRAFTQETATIGGKLAASPEDGAVSLSKAEVPTLIAARLAKGEHVAWVRGGVELGDRSWSARLLLARADKEDALGGLLETVQNRVPCAPCRVAVPAARLKDHFEVPDGVEHALRFAHLELKPLEGQAQLSKLAAADGRVWVQAIDQRYDPQLCQVLESMGAEGGLPMAAMTDFHLRGRPLVRSEADAVEAFQRSRLDALFVEGRLYERKA